MDGHIDSIVGRVEVVWEGGEVGRRYGGLAAGGRRWVVLAATVAGVAAGEVR